MQGGVFLKNKVEQLRKERGLNQDDFAKMLRVSRQTISSIETGKYNPSLELAFAISDFLANELKKSLSMKEVQKMKKSNLITGILYVLFGVACLIVALLIETKLEGILWGFAGAGIFPGIMMICKYFYWSSPKNKERYEERLENERIEQHDELKTKIRDRAGRYAYGIGLVVICFSILVFSILGALEVIDNARMIILYLSGYLMFQIITGIIIFNKLMKKY